MPAAVQLRDLKRQFSLLGAEVATQRLCEALELGRKGGGLAPEDVSLRDLALASIEDGEEYLRMIDPRRKSGNFRLTEAPVSAVVTANFSAITGQLVFSKVKEGYEYPGLLWPELCETTETSFIDGERIPGIGALGTNIEVVGESEAFPYLGLNQEYIDTPPTEKRGFIVAVTREMIIADRTGLLLQRAGDGGKFLSINKEYRVLDVATGQVNNYKRNGTALDTYKTSGAYVNSHSNTLVDYTDLENAELLFDAITDPNTSLPILLNPNNLAMLVPSALKRTAYRIVTATQGRIGDTSSATVPIGYFPLEGGLPKGGGAAGINNNYKVLSNAFVKARTTSASTWFVGDFKSAISYQQVWGIENMQMSESSEMSFSHDVSMRYKVSERGVPAMVEPRKLVRNV